MKSIAKVLACLLAATVFGSGDRAAADVKIDSGTFGGLEARAIGPAVMGGRISAMDVIKTDRLTIYVGAADGGVWKSVNGGTTFKAIFDEHIQSIGAITIDRSNPDVVWVGTGEPWTRNSISVGDGIYKTTDGGENWEHLGLKDTERMSKILIDPADSDTVYVCATGHLWNANEERGVYKTTDGGKSWEKILYVDEDTGCGDLAMDPQDPRILYASMWQFRRWPYFFKSGGPGSGLYKSTDSGKNWRKITKGLPEGELGRIAIAVAPSRTSVVYATVEAEKTGLYRSDDLGETWRWVGSTDNVEARPFYFSLLLVDPTDFNRVYKPATFTSVSTDGGETFSGLGGGTHPDHHAFWINPDDPDQLLVGTDGGLYLSNDRGVHWNFLQALPLSQFYHVSYDMEDPYNVYGGLQDNGSWMGPSQTPSGGVQNKHWDSIGFGDGFHVHVDRQKPDIVYLEWQGGRIQRVHKSTGESKDIQPLPDKGDLKYRFNWNAPIHLSPTRTDTLYIGAQFLFRSRDRGESWERISPDLTTDDPEKQKQIDSGGLTPDNSTAENHCTIFTISESPLNENLIWVGTDDGNLQVTRDGGKTWKNVVGNIPDLPKCTWVSFVEPGRYAEAEAYVTFDGHRTGDMKPYVYKTTDYGKTWTSLAADQIEGHCHVILQDLVNPDLLFLGTELGLYVSVDGGAQWARFKEKMPKVSVRDMAIHPREHDLILGTHGRGIYIIDDITPLRYLTREVLESKAAFLKTRPAVMRIPASSQEFPGDDEFVGRNPASGAQIAYYLKKRHLFGDLKLEIYDSEDNLLYTLPGAKRRGINRVSWSMRMKPPKVPPAASLVPQFFSFIGPQVPEGTYTVKLIKGKQAYEGTFDAVMDPRADYTPEGMALQDKTVMKLYRMLRHMTYLVDTLLDVQAQAKDRAAKLDDDSILSKKLNKFADELEAFRKTLVATRKGGFLAGEEQLREKLGTLYGSVNGYEGRPTDSQVKYMGVLEKELEKAEARLESLLAAQLDDLNPQLRKHNLSPVTRMSIDQ
ncbi:MAG: glycosyl hydrolase [Phycisphaerae bacterium]